MNINLKCFLLIITLALTLNSARSQTQAAEGIKGIISSIDTFRNRLPIEKLYLQFDKPYYTTGDTLWFKAYLLDAAYLKNSMRSGLLYIELANDTGKIMDRRMLSLSYGLGRGNIALNKEDIPEGSYTLRAYTNWMRNFGEDYVFKKNFYISNVSGQNWLVNSAIQQSITAGKDSIRLALQFMQLNGESLGLRELQLRLMEGKKILFRDKVMTESDGKLDVNFILPEKADTKNITLVAEGLLKGKENHKIPIPISINRPENMDLQFMPEGGNLVTGISSRIGFKAISEDGKGIDIKGKIYTVDGTEEVEVFSSIYKGMGSFELLPKAGESYIAKVLLSNGTTKSYTIPSVKSSGTTLRINNDQKNDSLELSISISPDLLPFGAIPSTYFLIGQSRGVVCYAARITLKSRETLRKIPKSAFPTGIARFTLFDINNQPLNERIIYIDRDDQLRITVNPDKESYGKRDSIALVIEVKDKEGVSVQGSFSVAVTDDSQIKTDSTANILTQLLLTSDLKGNIEDPNYYLQSSEQGWKALDNLLLTQGWVGYVWKNVFNPETPVYASESELVVKGKVSNVFNKPLAGTGIRLLSTNPQILRDTLTDQKGTFSFRGFPPLDTAKFFIEARNRNDKSFNIGVVVDEFVPSVFKASALRFMPWYLNSDTTLLRQIKTQRQVRQELAGMPAGLNTLEEVVITAKKIIKGSHNLNGPGEADLILDEKDMEKAKKLSLYELLFQRFPSINYRSSYLGFLLPYKIFLLHDRLVSFTIDGDRINPGDMEIFMNYVTAEDIIGIEIMSSPKNEVRYDSGIHIKWAMRSPMPPIYMEITTRSGKGAFIKRRSGTYFYKSMPFAGSKKFYRPKYIVRDTSVLSDLRSTIHWDPDIVTDKEGKAMASFYSADRPGTYTVIIEGSDLNGHVGYQRKKITVSSK